MGSVIYPDKIVPQKLEIRRDHLHTLNDFQKLLGDINWLRPFLRIPSAELKPLFDILEGDPHISSPRALTPAANRALRAVENALRGAQLQRIDRTKPFDLCVFKTRQLPTAALWQNGPLLWVHPNASPAKIINWYPDAVAQLALRALKAALTYFGKEPKALIVPYTAVQVQTLAAASNTWAVLVTSFAGQIDNHYPKHPILQFALSQAIVFPRVTSQEPLANGVVVYTDGSKTGIGAYVVNGEVISKQYGATSPQVVECLVVLEVLQAFPGPLNIVSDSSYVVNAVKILEVAGLIKPSSKLAQIFQQIQAALLERKSPVFITHIRAHSGLPGPMARGNDIADKATKVIAVALSPRLEVAKEFHKQFHVTAETLRRRFALSRKEAREIVTQCQNCCQFLPVPHVGVNPRGIRPLQVWQMDVTHIPSFGKNKFVHVTIDTFSGFIFATSQTGEASKNVIAHVLSCLAVMPQPKIIKTDNGPGYTSLAFKQFCTQLQIKHITGIPYNPQGQGVVERSHQMLKRMIAKLQSNKDSLYSLKGNSKNLLSHALFVINFLTLDDRGRSATDRLWHPSTDQDYAQAMWRDPLDSKWRGPDPVLIWGKGHACVYDTQAGNACWLPERLVKLYNPPREAP